MVKVCLISHGHPAGNPRLVREADALHEAGYDVVVITPRFVSRLVPFDLEIVNRARWRYECVNFLNGGRRKWNFVRARRRVSAALAGWLPNEVLVRQACNYANPELARLAALEKADLYVAHQHHSLPAAAWAARRTGGRFAFDAEDLLADSSAEPHELIRNIERRYLPDCAYISTMSYPAADRLRATNNLATPMTVLHNTPSIHERRGIAPPNRRSRSAIPSIYWFGQTLGPHSCAEQVIKVLPRLQTPLRLILRGAPSPSYVEQIRTLSKDLGVSHLLEIAPLGSPDQMVKLASEHDILFGSQPGREPFHQLAIGNKVFTGMMAGQALALSDTIAHRDLFATVPECGFLFPDSNEVALADQLNTLLMQPERLERMKQSSWDWAQRQFHWEIESRLHVAVVDKVCGRPT